MSALPTHAVRRRRAPFAARGFAQYQARQQSEGSAGHPAAGQRRTQLREVSLNAQGRVESYELGINFTFRLIDAKGNALIPDTTLSIYREMPYDDQIVQAKQGQIETLYKAMQRDLVSRLLPHDRARRAQGIRESRQERGRRGRAGVRPERGPAGQHSRPWQTPSTTDAPLSR